MKKLLVVLLVIGCLMGLATGVYAKTGSAIIPHFQNGNDNYMGLFFITNITEQPINVKVTFYKTDGGLIVGDDNVRTTGITRCGGASVINYNENLEDATVSFTLGANATVWVYQVNSNIGYGMIEWSQNSKATVGLISFGRNQWVYNGQWNFYSIPINNGLPF